MEERLFKQEDEAKFLAFIVLQQSLFVAAGYGLWLWAGGSAGDFLRFGWSDLLLGVGLAGSVGGVMVLLFLTFPAVRERMVREQGQVVFSTERPYGLGAILIISCSAGIGEEALFRGGIQTFAGTYVPAWAAILAATALFALAHPGSRMFMSLIAVISLIFGLSYHLTGSLLAVMVAHALHDIFGCFWVQRELRRLGHWGGTTPAAA